MSVSGSLLCCTTTTTLTLLLLLLFTPRPLPLGFSFAAAAGVPKGGWASPAIPVSGVIIPGFASSRLRAWALLDCPYSPLDFRPLDPVWLDTKKVLSVLNCWLKCMLLDPKTQADHPECKSRPDTGLSAITELDPGYITGALSSVWREWVNWLVEFGIEPDAIVAVPYDWRLPGAMLEERDLYFHKLKIIFETARKLRGGPSLVYAHSMGNNVFRYFLEWLKLEIAPKHYMEWLDHHIHAYYAVGAPLLGSAETVKALMSGVTFGLPISDGTARVMCNSFGSSLWMLPFSKHCHVDHKMFSNFRESDPVVGPHLVCDKKEYEGNSSSWPIDILKIDLPASPGSCPATEVVAHPMASLVPDVMGQTSQCSMPSQKSYTAHQVSTGAFLRDIVEHDVNSPNALYHLINTVDLPYQKQAVRSIVAFTIEDFLSLLERKITIRDVRYYLEDPILNPLTPWSRPPIKNVYCIYGVDMKTEVGYHYAPSGKPYPDNWIITDIIYETEGGQLQSRSGMKVSDSTAPSSGDATVPYNSLSYCKTWLGPRVNVTRTPQTAHEVTDMQEQLNVEHDRESDIVPNMTRDSRVKYITYYEDGVGLTGKRTAVWELDKIDHRNIVRSSILLREQWLETAHSYHKDAKRQFVSKERREPMRDEDCFWDYAKARCGRPDRCEYRYVFGDVHLGQSCRLQASSDKDHILRYI